MFKTTVTVDGMSCGMCEAHVNDTIRSAFRIKKVTSSFKTGKTEIISEEAISEEALKRALDPTGYKVTGAESEPYEKKGFSLFGRK